MDPLLIIPVAILVAVALIVYMTAKTLSAKSPAADDADVASVTQVLAPEIVAEPVSEPEPEVVQAPVTEPAAEPVVEAAPAKPVKPRAPRKPRDPSATKAPRVGAERKPRKPKAQ